MQMLIDGFGDINDIQVSCEQPVGYILDDQDCDDADAQSNPIMVKSVDGVDNNCDGDTTAATCDASQTLADWAVFSASGDDNLLGDRFVPLVHCIWCANGIGIC